MVIYSSICNPNRKTGLKCLCVWMTTKSHHIIQSVVYNCYYHCCSSSSSSILCAIEFAWCHFDVIFIAGKDHAHHIDQHGILFGIWHHIPFHHQNAQGHTPSNKCEYCDFTVGILVSVWMHPIVGYSFRFSTELITIWNCVESRTARRSSVCLRWCGKFFPFCVFFFSLALFYFYHRVCTTSHLIIIFSFSGFTSCYFMRIELHRRKIAHVFHLYWNMAGK